MEVVVLVLVLGVVGYLILKKRQKNVGQGGSRPDIDPNDKTDVN